MLHLPRTVLRVAGIFATIFYHDMANVDVTNYISMDSDVLPNHKSVRQRMEASV